LTYAFIGIYNHPVPTLTVRSDVFAAIAEPRRREIIDLLARTGAQTVGAIVGALRLPQPVVSKHLGVLRGVGLVNVVKDGRKRIYSLEAEQLRAVHEWVSAYERLWTHQLDRIKHRAERAATERPHDQASPPDR